jgi:hypothetical protein
MKIDTVAALSKACTIFHRSKIGVVGSNPIRDMGVCLRPFCVCVILCRYRIYGGADLPST